MNEKKERSHIIIFRAKLLIYNNKQKINSILFSSVITYMFYFFIL
jgi:hypothetical protein